MDNQNHLMESQQTLGTTAVWIEAEDHDLNKSEKLYDDSNHDDEKKPRIKQRSYDHKFQVKWLRDRKYSAWICRSRDSENKAYCNACDREISGSVTLVERHSKTSKHIRNVKKKGLLPPEEEIAVVPEIEEKVKSSKRLYNKEYRSSWEKDFQWLTYILEEDIKVPFCRLCNAALQSTRNALIAHSKSAEHKTFENAASLNASISDIPTQLDWNQIVVNENGPDSLVASRTMKEKHLDVIFEKTCNLLTKLDNEDKFTVFGKHIANELRDFTDPTAMRKAMHRINMVIFEEQTNQMNVIPTQHVVM